MRPPAIWLLLLLLLSPTAHALTLVGSPSGNCANIGTGNDWTGLGNTAASDNSRASASLDDGENSELLGCMGFDFSALPDTAVIDGIAVRIERRAGIANRIRDSEVRLLKAGVAAGSNYADTATAYPNSDTYASYGGASDLWGTTWSAAEIKASNFGVGLEAVKYASQDNAVSTDVDHMEITIHYTTGGGAGASGGCSAGTVGADTLVTCTGNGTVTFPSGVSSVRYLVVAGGGGGGAIESDGEYGAGGGGGGGVRQGTGLAVTAGTPYNVVVGAGGIGGNGSQNDDPGDDGGNSSFSTITAVGGGGGAAEGDHPGRSGGSGGGGSGAEDTGSASNGSGGNGTSGQGHDGGDADGSGGAGNEGGAGGGGGAGVAGSNGAGTSGGNGGIGVSDDITGTATYYGGGGGGGRFGSGSGGSGGLGGGGSAPNSRAAGNPATANSGGGGGGASGSASGSSYNGGAGGSGIVALRYTPSGTTATQCEGFESGLGNWSVDNSGGTNPDYGTVVIDTAHAQSGSRSMLMSRDWVRATWNQVLDTSGVTGTISFGYARGLGGDYPEPGDDLAVEYLNSGGGWSTLTTLSGANSSDAGFLAYSAALPANAQHGGFKLRFTLTHGTGDAANNYDQWNLDNVCVTTSGSTAPGGFNAFETNTAAGSVTGPIKTKIAGNAFSLDLVALNLAGTALDTSFTGDVTVDLIANASTGVTLGADNCPVSGTTLSVGTRSIASGRSSVGFPAVSDAWRDVRVRIRYPTTSPTLAVCSTDNFAIRPNALGVAATDGDWVTAGTTRSLNNTGATGGTTHKAGQPFTLTATGYNSASNITSNYAGQPGASITAYVLPSSCASCSLTTGTFSGSGGTVVSTTASYNEVGAFTLQLVDSTFASVDAADSSTAERDITSGNLNVGRFVPDHFDVAYNTPTFETACGSFTYLGQPFDYTVSPVLTATAKNAAGTTTANYTGSLFKLSAAGVTGQSYSAATGSLEAVAGSLPAATVADLGGGLASISFSVGNAATGGGLRFVRGNSPATAYDADIAFTASLADSEGVTPASNPVTFGNATAGNGIAFDAGNQMRFGRLRIANANGSELLALPAPLTAQYWNGQGFATNPLDNCTSLAAPTLTYFTQNTNNQLASGETSATLNSPFVAGIGGLRLSAPGIGNFGYLDLTITAPDWLKYNWDGVDQGSDGNLLDDNPRARAAFGKRKGSDKVIIRREIY